MKKLIVGLGNPGSKYEDTRHNIGFLVVQALANKMHASWKNKNQLLCKLAEFDDESNSVVLVMPMTYMNLSGQSAQKVAGFYRVRPSDMLVIVDDFYLPLGTFRFRERGSSGGHNGLKDIEEKFGDCYSRLRVGIDERLNQSAEEYVLSSFNAEQKAFLPKVIDAAVEITEAWLREGARGAISSVEKVNVRIKNE